MQLQLSWYGTSAVLRSLDHITSVDISLRTSTVWLGLCCVTFASHSEGNFLIITEKEHAIFTGGRAEWGLFVRLSLYPDGDVDGDWGRGDILRI